MKKIISLILVPVLLIAVSITAFATSTTETDTGNSQEVLASYEEGTQDKTIVSVDIGWNKMSFTYNGASEQTWDATNHKYVGEATEAHWAASDATITITNHSNSILQATISYVHEDAYSGISMHFTDNAPYIGSAYTDDSEDEDGSKKGTPCEVTIEAIPDGALPDDTVDNTKIGVITVKVTSDIAPDEVVDAISTKISACSVDAAGLARGGVYFAAGTDKQALMDQADAALIACYNENISVAEKNVIVNALITAFYGALDIVQ